MRLRSLLLVLFHECAFTMESGDGIDEDAPIKELEHFVGLFWWPSYNGSKPLGEAMAQVRQAFTCLRRAWKDFMRVMAHNILPW